MAAWNPKYKSIPVEDIRASGITYEQLIMRCLDKLSFVLIDCAKNESYLPVDAILRLIDSLIYPYHDEDYLAEKERIEVFLGKRNEWSYEHFKALMDWVKLISTKFAKMDILPEQKVGFIMGVGPANEHPELLQ